MSYLEFISDDEIVGLVKNVLDIGRSRMAKAEASFSKNVIDPFAALVESSAFGVDHETWVSSETIRQCQKTLQNHIGDLHQKILGKAAGWTDLGVGSVVDLVCHDRKLIAEVKNKHNTVTGGKLADQYYSMERLVTPKASQYKGYTSYFVNVIPKKPIRFDTTFEPSDKEKGIKCPKNELIRIIDGASFYALVTGDEAALDKLYKALPKVIEHIFQDHYGIKGYKVSDKEAFASYFTDAYGVTMTKV